MKTQPITNEMWTALQQAIEAYSHEQPEHYEQMRCFITNKLIDIQAANAKPFDFSKDFRHEITPAHGVWYWLASTVRINAESKFEVGKIA